MAINEAPFKLKLVYVFRINDEAHRGCLKVGDTYLSEDSSDPMQLVPNRRNRTAIAYSTLNVGETRALSDYETIFDVEAFPSEKFKSRAGITLIYKGEKVVGGNPINQSSSTAESFIRLAIRYKLLALARKEVHYL